jgi:hypothetical protein
VLLAGVRIDQVAQPAAAAALRTIAANPDGTGGQSRFTTRASNQPMSPRRPRTMPGSCLQGRRWSWTTSLNAVPAVSGNLIDLVERRQAFLRGEDDVPPRWPGTRARSVPDV